MNLFSLFSAVSFSDFDQDEKIQFLTACVDALAEEMGYEFEKVIEKEGSFFTSEEWSIRLKKKELSS